MEQIKKILAYIQNDEVREAVRELYIMITTNLQGNSKLILEIGRRVSKLEEEVGKEHTVYEEVFGPHPDELNLPQIIKRVEEIEKKLKEIEKRRFK